MKTLTGMRVGGVVLGVAIRIGGGVGDRVRSSRPTRWHMGLESREIEVRTWHRTEKPDVGIAAAGQGLKVTTTTLTVSGVNAQGQKVNTVALYIKK